MDIDEQSSAHPSSRYDLLTSSHMTMEFDRKTTLIVEEESPSVKQGPSQLQSSSRVNILSRQNSRVKDKEADKKFEILSKKALKK
jgi:hypothetical protein